MKSIYLLSAALLTTLSSSAFAALTAPPVRLVWKASSLRTYSSADPAHIDMLKANVLASCIGPAIETIKQASQTPEVKDAYKAAINLDADSKVDLTVVIRVDSASPMVCSSYDDFRFDVVVRAKDFNGRTSERTASQLRGSTAESPIDWSGTHSYLFRDRYSLTVSDAKREVLSKLIDVANEIRKNVKVRESAKDFSYVNSFGSNQI